MRSRRRYRVEVMYTIASQQPVLKETSSAPTHAFRNKNSNHRFHHQPNSSYFSSHQQQQGKAGIITTEEADNETAWRHASSCIHGSHGKTTTR